MFRSINIIFAVGLCWSSQVAFSQAIIEKQSLPERLQAYASGPIVDLRFLTPAEKADVLRTFSGQTVTLVNFQLSNGEAEFHASIFPSALVGDIEGEDVLLKGGTGVISMSKKGVARGGLEASTHGSRLRSLGNRTGDRPVTVDGIDFIFTKNSCTQEAER